jgi:hypothetical protein
VIDRLFPYDVADQLGFESAKNVRFVDGVDASDRAVLIRTLRRDWLAALVAQWPACLIGSVVIAAHPTAKA